MREQSRGRDADLRRGARQLTFCFDDIGPAPQQVDGQASPDANRQDRKHARPLEFVAEILGKLADQDRDDITRRVDPRDERCDLRLQ